jgi:hypothetical protein
MSSSSRSCLATLGELGGANARPNAEAVGKKPIKKKPVSYASAQRSISQNVRFGSLADMTDRSCHVRFTPDSGHSSAQVGCPLSANSGHHMSFSFGFFARSTESSTTVLSPVFFHQCETSLVSGITSPALCTIGTAQLLAYSSTSPSMM